MCGFVGAHGLAERPADDEAVALADMLRHRGPDSGSEYWRDGVWLAFRRLAVLDLSLRADQPMVDEHTGTTLAMNGEIYNYLELRSELEGRGHVFATTGDTEVFLRGFLEWGTSLFPRCEGMFAAAIRTSDGRVVLVRDRFGEKPLYYGRRGTAWWFGSEPGVVRAAGAGTGGLNRGRVLGFLGFGDIEDPADSYFEGIVQVPPGTYVCLDNGSLPRRSRWWRAAELLGRSWDAGAAGDEEVLAALDASVRLRLRSDVPVGTSLSGGVDSSGVVASLRAVDDTRELHAFTASFPGSSLDEWRYAKSIAEQFSVTLHRVEPDPAEFVAALRDVVRAQGAPIDSPSVFAQWCVMRAAQALGVTVLLDGQGADETWGGYPKHAGFALADEALRGRPDIAWRAAREWRRLGGAPRLKWTQAAGLLAPNRPRHLVAATAGGRAVAGSALAAERAPDPFGDLVKGRLLRRAAGFDLERGLLPRLLRFADRNSMAFGREVRLPYLDTTMVELGLRSNWAGGLGAGWTKLALRRALSRRLPREIAWRRDKIAYQVPDESWLQRPDIARAVEDATTSLIDLDILKARSSTSVSPWRRLSLAMFIDEHALSA